MALLVPHAALTWFLTGLIWVIQVVHYPLMAAVGTASYSAYQQAHVTRITWIVGPAMLAEVALALAVVLDPSAQVPRWQAWLGVALLALIWVATALWSVPAHGRLAAGFDAAVHRQLVDSNWLRTLAWTARGVLAGWWLLRAR
jgi:hypothetical protein